MSHDRMDTEATLSSLQRLVLAFRDARGWQQFHTPKELAAALAIEAAELQELFLWRTPAEITADLAEPARHSRVAEELADILIFLLYLAKACGVELEAALKAKIAVNDRKYPIAKSFGCAKKYTEL